ncbi:hypothetical protein O988_01466 [Pseudogymnoascus sp. VKM F-3808]|nr:hypothetical protein O988_01466 [Pseudogymnoascus sp. VKM F-3808]
MRSSLIFVVASAVTILASPVTERLAGLACSACPGEPCDAIVECPAGKCCGVNIGDAACVDCHKEALTCSACPGLPCLALIECPVGKCCGVKKGDQPCIDCPATTA